jgi:uncharacterized protein YoxC
MLLTFNQVLWLVLTMAAVIAVTFLVLFLIQLRKTAREGERTLFEVRELVKDLRETEQKIDENISQLAEIVQASKKTVSNLSEITGFVTTRVIRPSSKIWPFVFPMLRMSWQLFKKRKEKKNGR